MRIKELQLYMEDHRIDFCLFYSLSMEPDPNMYYFTHYSGVGCLIVPRKGTPLLLVPVMEFERAQKTGMLVKKLEKKKFFDAVVDHTKKLKPKNIGIDKDCFSVNVFRAFKRFFKKQKCVDVSLKCKELRTVKTMKEAAFLVKSCRYADKILQKCLSNFKEFKTESDVAGFYQHETYKEGLEVSFKPIVASGKNGSMPHYEPKKVKLNKGLCVFDCGVKYKGYCSDITRTISIGPPKKEEKRMYNFLREVQENTLSFVQQEQNCGKIHEYTVKQLGRYSEYFTHGLGHGVGVEIHELPNLKPESPDMIKNNVFFTVEPGIYFPGKFGIRIEDTVMFKNKVVRLTKTTKDLLIL